MKLKGLQKKKMTKPSKHKIIKDDWVVGVLSEKEKDTFIALLEKITNL